MRLSLVKNSRAYDIKRNFLMLVVGGVSILSLTSCGSASVGNHSLTWGVELWGSNFTETESGHCTQSSIGQSNYENNAPISLIGPDGSEISSTSLKFGVLTKTTENLETVSNPPKSDICSFTVTFPDVPVVATYRVKTRDGQVDPVSHPLADVQAANWSMFELLGAQFKK
jgi:hypothetical protein